MRCLQCGVEMALLKKLRNSTEFCSEDCGRKYQDESNQLAVSRLMQQSKPKAARAAVSVGRYGETSSVSTTTIAVTEPPLGAFLPQKVWATLRAHPVSSKVDWQLRKCGQVIPTLADEARTSMLALAFASINDTYGARGPRVGLIDAYLPADLCSLWRLNADRQPLQAYLPTVGQGWSARWPDHWQGVISIGAADGDDTVVEDAWAETPSEVVPASVAIVQPAKPVEAVAVVPPPMAALKATKPEVVHAVIETATTSEAIAMSQVPIWIPESTMLPLRPRIVIAPRTPSAPKVEKAPTSAANPPAMVAKEVEPTAMVGKPSEKPTADVRPILVTRPVEAPVAEAKAAETKIPEVKLEARRPGTAATGTAKAKVEPPSQKAAPKEEAKKTIQREAAIEKAAPGNPKETKVPIAVPTFGIPSKSSATTGLWHRVPLWEKVAAVIVFLLSIGGWLINGRPVEVKKNASSFKVPSPAASAPALGVDSWGSELATDLAGVARGRQLTIYRPSRKMKDYVIDFQGAIQERSLGWIVRALDTKNYYCLKLESDRSGSVKLVRFGVIDGREDSHTQLPLSLPPTTPLGSFKIRAEARGPKITTYVNGQAVDVWVDQRLTSGAAGFSNERGERALIKTVQVSF